ncbi:MAG: hypothetical protein JST93_07890 [Acidobacteria bacterium]|nr:hypothetical protein [Acidobacteriota bacterium]
MRTLMGMALALTLWAATATNDKGPGPKWESMPTEAVTAEAAPAAAPPQTVEPKAPSLADTMTKPAQAVPEPEPDIFPIPLRIAAALAVVAMVAYVAVSRLS